MSRKKDPALYELISQKQTQLLSSKPVADDPKLDDDDNLDHNVFTPGRSVRMPLGTIAVFVAVVIAMIMISYTLGFRSGSATTYEDYGNRLFEQQSTATFSEVIPTDLVENRNQILLKRSEITQRSMNSTNQSASPSPTMTEITPATPSSWGEIHSDPRATEMWYYTLVTTTRSGAVKLANFCRDRRLETYVIYGDNRYYRVIALPGSAKQEDAKMVETLSRIHAIGLDWAGTPDGLGDDLKDAYSTKRSNRSLYELD